MKKAAFILSICAGLLFAGCKGNPNTASGDSTGTGASGARVPGKTTTDTTRRGDATGAPAKDTSKVNRDSTSR